MLHLIPPPLHRAALRIAHDLRHRYRMMFRPTLSGVVVIVRDLEGKLLLVRHSYGPESWGLPGGGLKKGEDPREAAAREMIEETGCQLQGIELVRTIEEQVSGAPHTAHVLTATTLDPPRPDGREIIAAKFFPTHSLPEPLGGNARLRLTELGIGNFRRP